MFPRAPLWLSTSLVSGLVLVTVSSKSVSMFHAKLVKSGRNHAF